MAYPSHGRTSKSTKRKPQRPWLHRSPDSTHGELTLQDLDELFSKLHPNRDDMLTYHHLKTSLSRALEETLYTQGLSHSHRSITDEENDSMDPRLRALLATIFPRGEGHVDRENFRNRLIALKLPKRRMANGPTHGQRKQNLLAATGRRLHAFITIKRAKVLFVLFIISLQLACGLWQIISYLSNGQLLQDLGWGIVIAKTSAGALYPTLALIPLSMSRHLLTFLRKWSWVNQIIDWDASHVFHVRMSIVALCLATIHAIGHLSGDFLRASTHLPDEPRRFRLTYKKWLSSVPGWSGLTALGVFWLLGITSAPQVRRRCFEIFQGTHLLVYLFVILLCIHGSRGIIHPPVLGYWLAAPVFIMVAEKCWRLYRTTVAVSARCKLLKGDTIYVQCFEPRGRDWKYSVGQYIMLQIPTISIFEWHPFTVSACRGNILQIHARSAGNWTTRLQDLAINNTDVTSVRIDGPFGAPAQKFYDYHYTLIIGGGIGITPYAAILTDLEAKLKQDTNPWLAKRLLQNSSRFTQTPLLLRRSTVSARLHQVSSKLSSRASSWSASVSQTQESKPVREVELHWMVRDSNCITWFAELLNEAQRTASQTTLDLALDLKLKTYITGGEKDIVQYFMRYFLDTFRSVDHPYSSITGMVEPSSFVRPDFDAILNDHLDNMIKTGHGRRKVGVFYCGGPQLAHVIRTKCYALNKRARAMGSGVRYEFNIEVF